VEPRSHPLAEEEGGIRTGVWVVRTALDSDLLVHEFVRLLTSDGGAAVIAVRITKKTLSTNGVWLKRMGLLKSLIEE